MHYQKNVKNIYINSRLHPLLLGIRTGAKVKTWIFSGGENWLLMTPDRLASLAARLGTDDGRVYRLLSLARRHSPTPELFCRRLGVGETSYYAPKDYPVALCPHCDGVHRPHPEDAGMMCPACRERDRAAMAKKPGGGAVKDSRLDFLARKRLWRHAPGAFDGGVLSPNHQYNKHRVVLRDWSAAVNRILMGGTYAEVSREFACSVGLLHKKVKEHRPWENN